MLVFVVSFGEVLVETIKGEFVLVARHYISGLLVSEIGFLPSIRRN